MDIAACFFYVQSSILLPGWWGSSPWRYPPPPASRSRGLTASGSPETERACPVLPSPRLSCFSCPFSLCVYQGCGSGSRRAKMTHKSRKKFKNFMFWSVGCSFLRAEGLSCNVLYGGQGIEIVVFAKKNYFFSAVIFFNFLSLSNRTEVCKDTKGKPKF